MYWGDKPYNSLNYHLKNKFKKKIAKISIDAGFTCPNRDGTKSFKGCIFCSKKGSGDFTQDKFLSIKNQIEISKKNISLKWKNADYIVYFQAYTNTYANVDILKKIYYDALKVNNICGIAIATRPDCLSYEILELLSELNKKTYLWIELGFQTSNEKTAKFINRCYSNNIFNNAIIELKKRNIEIVVHTIFGLPYETHNDMINTIKYVTSLDINGLKIQSLYIVSDSNLYNYYLKNRFKIMEKDEYINLIIKSLEIIPQNIVIHRLTGDANKKNLIEPLWSLNKKDILNTIHKRMIEQNSFQGKLFTKI